MCLVVASGGTLLLGHSPFLIVSSTVIFNLVARPVEVRIRDTAVNVVVLLLGGSGGMEGSVPEVLAFSRAPLPDSSKVPVVERVAVAVERSLVHMDLGLSVDRRAVTSVARVRLIVTTGGAEAGGGGPVVPPTNVSLGAFKDIVGVDPKPLTPEPSSPLGAWATKAAVEPTEDTATISGVSV